MPYLNKICEYILFWLQSDKTRIFYRRLTCISGNILSLTVEIQVEMKAPGKVIQDYDKSILQLKGTEIQRYYIATNTDLQLFVTGLVHDPQL